MSLVVDTVSYSGRENLEVMKEAANYNRWLCSLVATRAPRACRMLDFGAGSGTFARVFAAQGFEMVCVEPDEVLRQTLASVGLNAFSSLDSLPAGVVDFVYTFNVLEHIEDDRQALMLLTRSLRPGGTLLVYVPAFEILFSSMDERVGHFRRYRLGPLVRMIKSCGLRVTYARYGDCLGFLATMAYKSIGASDGTITPASVKFFDRLVFPMSRLLDPIMGRFMGKNAIVVAEKA
jgi:SAM-dependent methyltransferase